MTSDLSRPATELASDRFRGLDAWEPSEILTAMWEAQLAAVAAVQTALPRIESAAAACVTHLNAGGRLIYAGAGTSGRIGVQDGAELPPTFDWPENRLVLLMAGGDQAFTRAIENAEDDAGSGAAAIARHQVGPHDVVIGIAASGSTPYTVACLREAAARGACTVAVSNSAGGAILAVASHPILVATGSEVIAGSTRMKAGTAQKVVLNLLSSLIMVRMGRVHDGLMVDMLARNAKLRGRAERMLMHISGCTAEAGREALQQAGGRVKIAVLVLRGLKPELAETALSSHGNSLRAALTALPA